MCAYIWLISMGFHVGIYIYGTRQPWMRHGWLSFEVYSFNVLEKTIPERRFCRDLDFFLFFFPRYYIGTSCKVFHHGWFERFGPLKAGSWLLVLKNTNFWSTQIEPNQLSATIQSVSSHEEERSLLETSMAPAGLLAIRYIQFTTAKSGWGSGWNVWIPWSDLHWGVETSLTQKSCSQRVPCAGLRRRSMSPTR